MLFASYNVQFGTGKDGRVDLARLAAEIGAAEVIALQEVDRYWQRSGMMDQAAGFAALFPEHHWVYGAGLDLAGGKGERGRRRQFGNMVLARPPILASRNHLLPKLDLGDKLSLQRSALEAVIETGAKPLRVYSVHLAHAAAAERLAQVEGLHEILAQAAADGGAWSGRRVKPVWAADGAAPPVAQAAVLLGDFNCTPDSAEYRALTGDGGLADGWRAAGGEPGAGATCLEDGVWNRIDYAFLSPELAGKARSMRVDAAAEGSDHQPIWIELDV